MAARLTAYLVALIVGATFIAGLIVGAQRDDDGPVDLIVVNGRVYTPDGSGDAAEAVAVQGNRILLVGSTREVHRLRRAQTVVIDAKGGAILPGFDDAHAHLLAGGLALSQLDLAAARTSGEIEDAVRLWAGTHPEQEWVLGRGWRYDAFAGGLPTRQLLDQLVPDRPAYLLSADGHTGWANSRALKLAGITRRSTPPANGTIVKDTRGEPTGVLRASAMSLVNAVMPQPDRDDRLAALRAAIAEAHRNGVTSVQNMSGSPDELQLYDELRRAGDLDLRVYPAITVSADVPSDELDRLEQLRDRYANDPVLKMGAVTLTVDGAISAQTAAMLEPYGTDHGDTGSPLVNAERLNRLVAELDRRGWQVVLHAAGDRAVRMGLDAFEHAAAENAAPSRGRRHRIEHVENVDPADMPRFARLGVTASMQPSRGSPDAASIALWTTQLGAERAARVFAYGSIARAGGEVVFGSDWPAAVLSPLLGIHVGVNRMTPDGEPEGGWQRQERISLPEALDAYTRTAAWASYDEHRKGTLARDMLADLVVLSKDIFTLPASRLAEAAVEVTIFDGRVVFQRSSATDD
jgi:predicted amidohydrolase YtcJ